MYRAPQTRPLYGDLLEIGLKAIHEVGFKFLIWLESQGGL